MAKQEIIDFIQEASEKGFSSEDIHISLVAQKWPSNEIKEAVKETNQVSLPEVQPAPQAPGFSQPTSGRPNLVAPKLDQLKPSQLLDQKQPIGSRLTPLPVDKSKKIPFLKSKLFVISALSVGIIAIGLATTWAVDSYVLKTTSFAQLLPEDIQWYIAINTDSQSNQVQQLNKLIEKFPMAQEVGNLFDDIWDNIVEDGLEDWGLNKLYPFFREIKEVAMVQVEPFNLSKESFDLELKDLNIVLIAKQLGQEKQKELFDLLQTDNDFQAKVEKYRGQNIFILEFQKSSDETSRASLSFDLSELSGLSISILDDFVVIATSQNDLKKIIDVYKDQSLFSAYKFSRQKSLMNSKHYQQLAKHFVAERLLVGYGANIDFDQQLGQVSRHLLSSQAASVLGQLDLSADLTSSLDSFGSSNISLLKDMISAQVIWVEQDNLKIDSFILDLKTDRQKLVSFSALKSLANVLPEKINSRWVDFYGEAKDLEQTVAVFSEMWQRIQEEMTSQLTETGAEEKDIQMISNLFQQFFEGLPKLFNQYFSLNFAKDLLPYVKGNFAYFIAPAFDGQKPEIGLIAEISQPALLKENLKALKLNPNAFFVFMDSLIGAVDPSTSSIMPDEDLLLVEPTLTLFEGTEIYSILPFDAETDPSLTILNDLLSFSYAVKNDKLIVASSQAAVINIIQSLSGVPMVKLAQNKNYQAQFSHLPQEIESVSYFYPYGIWGLSKYLLTAVFSSLEQEISLVGSIEEVIQTKELIFNFAENLFVPYLKTVKTIGLYSFSQDNLKITGQTMTIEELPKDEKEKVKDAWQFIESLMGASSSFENSGLEYWGPENNCHGLATVNDCHDLSPTLTADQCFSCFAQMYKESSFCQSVTDQIIQGNCYLSVALELDDSSLCQQITNQDQKQMCLSLLK